MFTRCPAGVCTSATDSQDRSSLLFLVAGGDTTGADTDMDADIGTDGDLSDAAAPTTARYGHEWPGRSRWQPGEKYTEVHTWSGAPDS